MFVQSTNGPGKETVGYLGYVYDLFRDHLSAADRGLCYNLVREIEGQQMAIDGQQRLLFKSVFPEDPQEKITVGPP